MHLNPSRELDALIAEKIFGWTRGEHLGLKRVVWSLPAGELLYGLDWASEPPHYSTSIEAAWEVVARFESAYSLSLTKHTIYGNDTWDATMWPHPDISIPTVGASHQGLGESAPHAICLAALKTVSTEQAFGSAP